MYEPGNLSPIEDKKQVYTQHVFSVFIYLSLQIGHIRKTKKEKPGRQKIKDMSQYSFNSSTCHLLQVQALYCSSNDVPFLCLLLFCNLLIAALGVTCVDQLCSVFGHQFDHA